MKCDDLGDVARGMGCGRSRSPAPTSLEDIQHRPIQVQVMFGTESCFQSAAINELSVILRRLEL